MINLNQAPRHQVEQWGHDLYRTYFQGWPSFQAVAQALVHTLGNGLVNDHQQPISALVRVFYAGLCADLPAAYRGKLPTGDGYCLSLMATMGIEAAWCDVYQSRRHQVVPVDDMLAPMFQAAFRQTAIEQGVQIGTDLPTNLSESGLTQVFYVPQALGSPIVPDQAEFVELYGIKSVVGIGSSFLEGGGYLLLVFSRMALSQAGALAFGELAPFISTLLAVYHKRGVIWA